MSPTLLSLAGINGAYPMLGYDLTKNIDPNRAFMQYNQTQAMIKGNDVVILKPKVAAKGYQYDKKTNNLTVINMIKRQII